MQYLFIITVLVADILVYFPAVYWVFAARKVSPFDTGAIVNLVGNKTQIQLCYLLSKCHSLVKM